MPNNRTVAKIRAGNSNIRNPILVSYIAKGLLPYRGLGSGLNGAGRLAQDDFSDDQDGCLFTATVHRKEVFVQRTIAIGDNSEKSSEKILEFQKVNPE